MSESTAASPDELRAALSRTASGGDVEVRETHISWVLLTHEQAYKLKKPLVLPFLDYGTAARRLQMCDAEVRLNSRLAPGLYLGVRAVIDTGAGLELADRDADGAIDYVVAMRRYDERRTLAARLDRGELLGSEVLAVARTLAAFHASCPPVASDAGRARREIERNLDELLEVAELRAERHRIHAIGRLMRALLDKWGSKLARRARRGLTRECHGDLRAEHVLLDGSVSVVDCVEFDPELRTLDVGDDLAFLVMDLTALGGERFARELVDEYRGLGGDCGDDALLSFYAAHRALIRAKVLLVRASQSPQATAAHGDASVHARDLLSLAEQFSWRARLPLALVICGVPASGKSELASALAEVSRLPPLNSDVVRKRLAGLSPARRAARDRYTAEVNRATYAELGRRAATTVAEQGGVIVDATFRHREDRDAFSDGFGAAAPLRFIECRAADEVLMARAVRRDRNPRRVSDATLEVVLRERRNWEPLDEVPERDRTTIDTDRPIETLREQVIEWLDQQL